MARRSGLSFAKKRRKLSGDTVRDVFNYILGIILAVGFGIFIVYNWGIRTSVIGVSMENTLYNGQTIFISKLSYLVMKPKVGDIIVFKPNGNETRIITSKGWSHSREIRLNSGTDVSM